MGVSVRGGPVGRQQRGEFARTRAGQSLDDTIANMARNYIAQFSQPALQQLFKAAPGKTRVRPEDVIDKGLLLIVSLSPVLYGEAATPFRMAVKKAFCQRVLQRNHLCIIERGCERPINQVRPILYVCDEFHTTLNAKGQGADGYFLDRAREFRCMCVLATQGISAIQSVLGCPHSRSAPRRWSEAGPILAASPGRRRCWLASPAHPAKSAPPGDGNDRKAPTPARC